MKTREWRGVLRVLCCGAAAALVALACEPGGTDMTDQPVDEQAAAISLPSEALTPIAAAASTGCADGTVEQQFAGGIVGCAGMATFPNRATLCGAGYHPLNAQTWQMSRGTDV